MVSTVATGWRIVRASSARGTRFLPIVGLLGMFTCWQILAEVFAPDVSVQAVAVAVVRYLPSAEVLTSLLATLRRVATGLVLGSGAAIVIGVIAGFSRPVDRALETMWSTLRPVSPIAWVPLATVWFGISEKAAVFVIAYATFFPVLLGTSSGLRDVRPVFKEAAATLGAKRLQTLWYVVLPSALPQVISGIRIAVGLSWAVIVAAELVIGSVLHSGLGYLMMNYTLVTFNLPRVAALVVLIGIMGYLFDLATRWITRLALPWSRAS